MSDLLKELQLLKRSLGQSQEIIGYIGRRYEGGGGGEPVCGAIKAKIEAEEKLAKLGAMVFEAYLYDDTITVDVCGRISKYVDAAGLGDSFDEQGRLKNSVKETIEELNRE